MSRQPLLSSDSNTEQESVLSASCCCCCVGACCLLQVGLMAAGIAFSCFLFLITGHAILRCTDLAVYNDFSIHSSMQVGAAGGVIILLPSLIVAGLIEGTLNTEAMRRSLIGSVALNMLNLAKSTATGAAAGWAGSKVLLSHGYIVMDPVHAARAGALGGVVLGPCIIIGTILFALIVVGLSNGYNAWKSRQGD